MTALNQFLAILTIGVIGGIIYTVVTNQNAIQSAANGVDTLYKTAVGATFGRVA